MTSSDGVLVADGVTVEPRAVGRIVAGVARSVDGVVGLEPAARTTQRRDALAGAEPEPGEPEPDESVLVELAAADAVRVDVALAVGGRPARDIAVDVVKQTRDVLRRQLGVRAEEVRVTIIAVAVPGVAEA